RRSHRKATRRAMAAAAARLQRHSLGCGTTPSIARLRRAISPQLAQGWWKGGFSKTATSRRLNQSSWSTHSWPSAIGLAKAQSESMYVLAPAPKVDFPRTGLLLGALLSAWS